MPPCRWTYCFVKSTELNQIHRTSTCLKKQQKKIPPKNKTKKSHWSSFPQHLKNSCSSSDSCYLILTAHFTLFESSEAAGPQLRWSPENGAGRRAECRRMMKDGFLFAVSPLFSSRMLKIEERSETWVHLNVRTLKLQDGFHPGAIQHKCCSSVQTQNTYLYFCRRKVKRSRKEEEKQNIYIINIT